MYEFNPYHVTMALLGLAIIAAYWLPRFFSGREPAASALLIAAGFLLAVLVPAVQPLIDPTSHPEIWEHAAEAAVIISLFGTGLRIDRLMSLRQWRPTIGLLVIGMPLSIAAVALAGWLFAGMTLAGALLLGAVLAPTDPVLAGEVQVGRPLEGGEHPVRLALTAEAGLNDGLAFPFVHLALLIAAAGAVGGDLLLDWALRDVVYRIAMGALAGMVLGWLLAKILFAIPRKNPLADTGAGVVAIAGVLVCYGTAELLEGYGFVASFIAGLTLRRMEARHEFHRTLHSFTETVELTLTAFLLVGIGVTLPMLWPQANWAHLVIGLGLIFIVRPLAGFASLWFTELRGRQRIVVAFFGVRGIGSIYYIAYAGGTLDLVNESGLWSTVALTICASTLVHGLTAGIAVERVTAEEDEEASGAGEPSRREPSAAP